MGAGEGRGEGRYSGKKCRLVSMFSLTFAFFLVEIVVGKKTCNEMLLINDMAEAFIEARVYLSRECLLCLIHSVNLVIS